MTFDRLLEKIAPFFILGISIAAAFALLTFVSYVLFWGLVIGGLLYAVIAIKDKFFPTAKTVLKTRQHKHKHKAQTYNHDDFV